MPATKEDIDRVNNAQNHYQVLGLEPSATHEEIRTKYKKLSLLFHPDKNQNSGLDTQDAFKKVSAAHEVLSDNNLRQNYDNRITPKISMMEKLLNAITNFCKAILTFFKSMMSKQEHTQENIIIRPK